ncbi:MAG: hypothetical protein KC503_25685 [Myxococcales bacterium]|nr:hypothetical protein [Myxococcales bacterium]
MNWKKLFRNLVIGGAALGGGVIATQVTIGCSDSPAPPGDVARIGAADISVPRIGPSPGDSTIDVPRIGDAPNFDSTVDSGAVDSGTDVPRVGPAPTDIGADITG